MGLSSRFAPECAGLAAMWHGDILHAVAPASRGAMWVHWRPTIARHLSPGAPGIRANIRAALGRWGGPLHFTASRGSHAHHSHSNSCCPYRGGNSGRLFPGGAVLRRCIQAGTIIYDDDGEPVYRIERDVTQFEGMHPSQVTDLRTGQHPRFGDLVHPALARALGRHFE